MARGYFCRRLAPGAVAATYMLYMHGSVACFYGLLKDSRLLMGTYSRAPAEACFCACAAVKCGLLAFMCYRAHLERLDT